eukprot:16442900-Heterocapsa_arctica.AAC.1
MRSGHCNSKANVILSYPIRQKQGLRTMDRYGSHTELLFDRTCVPGCNFDCITKCQEIMCNNIKKCFTCCAFKFTSERETCYPNPETSSIVKFWVGFKASCEYSNLSHHAKLSKLAVLMADTSEERKSLSKLGAARLSRNEALRFLASKEKFCNYYTLMVYDTDDSGAKQLGYIMYQDLSNKPYAAWLSSVSSFLNKQC